MVLRAVGQNDVGPGRGGVHGGAGGFHVGAAALVDAVEDDGRGHGAGNVHPVQNQGDHRPGVGRRVPAEIDGELPGGEHTGHPVVPGLGDGDHRVGRRLLGGVGVRLAARPVGLVVTVLVVDDVRPGVDGGGGVGGDRRAVHGAAPVREEQGGFVRRLRGLRGGGGGGRARTALGAAGGAAQGHGCREQQGGNLLYGHKRTLLPYNGYGRSVTRKSEISLNPGPNSGARRPGA